MKCTNVKNRLGAYLDGELDATIRARMAEHLLGCNLCQAELAAAREFEEAVRALQRATPETASSGFLARVVQAARTETARAETKAQWSLREWLWSFSLPMRTALVSAVVLVALAGIKSGHVVTDLVARQSAPKHRKALEMLELTPAERHMLQLATGLEIAALQNSDDAAAPRKEGRK